MRYPREIAELALATRALVLEEAPEAAELNYDLYTVVAAFTFTGSGGDSFIHITGHAKWVNLGFTFGSLLPDPGGMLRGEGKQIRHIRITKKADLENPDVRSLVRAAIELAERPEAPQEGAKPKMKGRGRATGR